jgi:hypothetical protein
VKNEVLRVVKEERNILHTIKQRKGNWTGYNLRGECLLKYVVEGKIEEMVEVTKRQGRRRKQLPNNLTE